MPGSPVIPGVRSRGSGFWGSFLELKVRGLGSNPTFSTCHFQQACSDVVA